MTTEQEKKLNEVHDAIVGNRTGNNGIIPRLEELEKYKQRDQKLKWSIAGGLAVLQGFWHWITN